MLNMKPLKQLKFGELKQLFDERWAYPPELKEPRVEYTATGQQLHYDHNEPPIYKACWQQQLGILDAKFLPCWEYPPARYKTRPPPPPCRGATVPVDVLLPNFEACIPAKYTRCDYKLAQFVHQQILRIEEQFTALEAQLTEAKKLQIDAVKQMRYHATRYRILANGGCCTKLYPEYVSRLTEQRALCDFQKAFNVVNQSNLELAQSVIAVRDAFPELQKRISQLDTTLQSTFIAGEGYGNPPLGLVVQMLQDLYNYFFGVACKYKCWARLMDPEQEFSIEDYLALLQSTSDFETFMHGGVGKCTCKRCDDKNPLTPYLPCWCQQRDFCEPRIKLPDMECILDVKVKLDPSDSGYVEEQSTTSLLEAQMEKIRQEQEEKTQNN